MIKETATQAKVRELLTKRKTEWSDDDVSLILLWLEYIPAMEPELETMIEGE